MKGKNKKMMKDRKMGAMRGKQMIKQERSEYGKQIRKEYEGGGTSKKREQIYNSLNLEKMDVAIRSRQLKRTS